MNQFKMTHVDGSNVKEVFADTVRSVNLHDGVIRIELSQTSFDDPKPNRDLTGKATSVARIFLTQGAGVALQQSLLNLANMIQQQQQALVQKNAGQTPGTPSKQH